MKAVFRVDGSSKIGVGHISRCLTLAQELKAHGVSCTFISRSLPEAWHARIPQSGFRLVILEAGQSTKPDQSESERDAKLTIKHLGGATDWLIVDNYTLDRVWETLLRPHTRRILVIDDLAVRHHDCDVIVDHNIPESSSNPYAELTPATCLSLIGPRYALLPDAYRSIRARIQGTPESRDGVLIFFSGGADQGLTQLAMAAMTTRSLARRPLTVVIGGSNPESQALFRIAQLRPRTSVLGTAPHLADLMAKSAIGIGAGGVTSLERLCLGLPSVVTTLAQNQIRSTQRLADLQLLRYLGHWPNVDSAMIADATESLLHDTAWSSASSASGMELVDGFGASRVADVMLNYS